MSAPIDDGIAVTVQDLANELKVYHQVAAQDRDVHPWPRYVWSLWSKTFVRSAGCRVHPKSPAMPEDLVGQVTGLDSLSLVVIIVGRARAAVSGQRDDVEIAYVDDHIRRFLATSDGRSILMIIRRRRQVALMKRHRL